MPAVNELLVPAGMSFTQVFAPTPLCYPSRVMLLRGQYAYNHTVLRNTGEDAGFAQVLASGGESDTVATRLQAAGYNTTLIGKHLNGYAGADNPDVPFRQRYVPPGCSARSSSPGNAGRTDHLRCRVESMNFVASFTPGPAGLAHPVSSWRIQPGSLRR